MSDTAKNVVVFSAETTMEAEARTGRDLVKFGLVLSGALPAEEAERVACAEFLMEQIEKIRAEAVARGLGIEFFGLAMRSEVRS